MKNLFILCCILVAAFLVLPVSASVHTIQFQNHCSYDVSVVISGGLQYKPDPVNHPEDTYGACQCLPANYGGICNPTTKCDYAACGDGNKNLCDTGTPLVDGGGFMLDVNSGSHTTTVPMYWQGAFWPRTDCHHDSSGNFNCDQELQTCRAYQDGQGKLQCGGHGISLATKGEINFDENGVDTYDVSAVDGFNVPMTIELVPGTGDPSGLQPPEYACNKSGTITNLLDKIGMAPWNTLSSSKLVLPNANGKGIAIQSACSYASTLNHKNNDPNFDTLDALTNQTCCIKPWGSAQDYENNGNIMCDPTTWPEDINTAGFFKYYLPPAYSYAYDDHTSTYTCRNRDENTLTQYIVTFCGANEGQRINLPGDDTHTHVPVIAPTPLPTPAPALIPVPTQTPVPQAPYNPDTSGDVNF